MLNEFDYDEYRLDNDYFSQAEFFHWQQKPMMVALKTGDVDGFCKALYQDENGVNQEMYWMMLILACEYDQREIAEIILSDPNDLCDVNATFRGRYISWFLIRLQFKN